MARIAGTDPASEASEASEVSDVSHPPAVPTSEPRSPASSKLTRFPRRLWRSVSTLLLGFLQACHPTSNEASLSAANAEGDAASPSAVERQLASLRVRMVDRQVAARGLRDPRVLEALRTVRRHRFAPDLEPERAYEDRPHPIGEGQTISQPYIVALMSDLAEIEAPCKVLEIGTGSGYQAAVLAEMGCEVYSIEIIESLAEKATRLLAAEGYADRVHVRAGDGYRGWPEAAPFDAILVTAAAPRVPEPLLEQLAVGARLVIPVGEPWQTLEVHQRTEHGIEARGETPVRFVPMTGEIRRR